MFREWLLHTRHVKELDDSVDIRVGYNIGVQFYLTNVCLLLSPHICLKGR